MKAQIKSDNLNRIIAATKGFVDRTIVGGKRELYRFIRLEFCAADSMVTAVAVDGYRLSVEHSVCECDEDFVAYVNSSTHLPAGKNAVIEVVNSEAIIRCGDFIFGCPQKEGEFLDWRKALPDGEPSFMIGVNGDYLLTALQAAKVSAGKSFKEPVVLEFRGETKPIILRTNGNDIKMVLPVRLGARRRNHESI